MQSDEAQSVEAATNQLVDAYRSRCLWFLRSDYYPSTLDERIRVLGYIERHGDAEAYRRAGSIRQWLSRLSKETSAG